MSGGARADGGTPSELDLFRLDENIKTSVVSATKSEQPIEAAPAIIDTISREEILSWGYRTMAEVLGHVVGFYVPDDHIIPNVAVRGVTGGLGADSSIIKVLIDGHSVAFRPTAGNWLGAELVPLTAIERIEILRGPGSALYGADAFLGVINIITRSGESLDGAQLKTHLGISSLNPSAPAGDLDVSAGFARGSFDVMVGARIGYENRSGLLLPSPSPAAVVPSYHSGSRAASGLDLSSRVGFAKLTYSLHKHTTFTLSGYLSSIDRGAEFAPWSQLSRGLSASGVSNGTQISLYQGIVALNVRTTRLRNLTLALDIEYFNGRPTSSDRVEVNSDIFWVRRHFGASGVDLNLEAQGKLPHHLQIVGGVGFIYDFETLMQVQQVLKSSAGTLPAGTELPPTVNPNGESRGLFNLGAYLQVIWQLIPRLSLTGGIRYDYHSVYGSQPSGRLALVTRLAEQLHLKLLYGGAFKAPSPFLLYTVPLQVGDVIGNPQLQPQYVHTVEGQISYRPRSFLHLSTGLVGSLLERAAQFTLQGVNQVAANSGQIRTLAWETQIEAHYKEWIKGYLNGEYNFTQRDTGYVGYKAGLIGNGNVVYPPVALRLGVLSTLARAHLRLGFDLSYFGPRNASDANAVAAGVVYELPGYVLMGASLSTVGIKLIRNHETTFFFSAKNLLGATGPDPGFSGFDYPLAPRTYWFELRQQL